MGWGMSRATQRINYWDYTQGAPRAKRVTPFPSSDDMEQIKIDNFKRENGTPFPHYRTLSESECREIRERLAVKLGLPDAHDGLELVRRLASKEGRPIRSRAQNPTFDLQQELSDVGIKLDAVL